MTARGMSVHIGLNSVDPRHYAGWSGRLAACENDARDMAGIARSRGFVAATMTTAAARADDVLAAVGRAAATLGPGDTFLLTFAGHGAQWPSSEPSERDGLDETLVLYDRMIPDNEIADALSAFVAGVRVIVVADSCHSGTVVRARLEDVLAEDPALAQEYPDHARFRAAPPPVVEATIGSHPQLYERVRGRRRSGAGPSGVLLLAACQDKELAADGPRNGLFTGALKAAWAGGSFRGSYLSFRDAIDRLMPTTQNPNLLAVGTDAEPMTRLQPFALRPAGTTVPPGAQTSPTPEKDTEEETMSTVIETDVADNWSEVAEALRLRIPLERSGEDDGIVAAALDNLRSTDGLQAPMVPVQGGGARRGGVVVRTFWWGFHLEIDHATLEDVLSSADTVNALVGTIGGSIPSPAQPWIALAAKFVAGVHALLRTIDQGAGVYISMSWFAPGVFVPTTVPGGRGAEPAAAGARDVEPVGEPHEFWVNESDRDVDTGLYIQPGQRIVFSATGEIWAGVWFTGRNGPQGWMGWTANANSPLPNGTPFALLARLDGRYMPVGTGREFIYRGRGSKLFLRINDDAPGNGNGAFQVNVQVYTA